MDRYHRSMMNFVGVLDQCNLLDLGFYGPPFTWTNKQDPSSNIQERLDRFIVTLPWKIKFLKARVVHLDYFGSDHRMIKLELRSPQTPVL